MEQATTAINHTCHVPYCQCLVPPKLLMCRNHWGKVPKKLQNEVYRCYRPGQEIDKQPSQQYLTAAKVAIDYVVNLEKNQ